MKSLLNPPDVKVIAFPKPSPSVPGRESKRLLFDGLTYRAVMDQHAAGELPAGIVSALLIGCGVQP
jgi:hypothetical protein